MASTIRQPLEDHQITTHCHDDDNNNDDQEEEKIHRIRIRPIVAVSMFAPQQQQQQHSLVVTLPVSLGRQELATCWWKACPRQCQAWLPGTAKLPCAAHCRPVRRRAHLQALSRSMLAVNAQGRVRVTAKHPAVVQWKGGKGLLSTAEFPTTTTPPYAHLHIGPSPGRPWMRFEVSVVTQGDDEPPDDEHHEDNNNHKPAGWKVAAVPPSRQAARRILFESSSSTSNSSDSNRGGNKKRKLASREAWIESSQESKESSEGNCYGPEKGIPNRTAAARLLKQPQQRKTVRVVRRDLPGGASSSATVAARVVTPEKNKEGSDGRVKATNASFDVEENPVLEVRMPSHALDVDEGITSPLTMTQPHSLMAPSERPPLPNFGSVGKTRGNPDATSAMSSPLVPSGDDDHSESLATTLSLPGDGGRLARGFQKEEEEVPVEERAVMNSVVPPVVAVVQRCRDMTVGDWKSLHQRSEVASFHRTMSDLVLAVNAERGDDSQDLWIPPILGEDATIRLTTR